MTISEIEPKTTIVIPVNFEKVSEQALPFAVKIANAIKGRLALVHIENPSKTNMPKMDDPFVENVVSEMGQKLSELKKKLQAENEGLDVLAIHRLGKFHAEMVKIANHADLVVLGTKGCGTLKSMVSGSNTSQLIGSIEAPMFVVPKNVNPQQVDFYFEKVAFASEFSKEDIMQREIHDVVSFAEIFGSELTFIHVEKEFLELSNPKVVPSGAGSMIFPPQYDTEDVQRMARAKGRRMRRKITKITDYPKRHFVVLSVTKSDNIQDSLDDWTHKRKIGTLALVRRQRGVMENLFHTSVTKKISEKIQDIPILIYTE